MSNEIQAAIKKEESELLQLQFELFRAEQQVKELTRIVNEKRGRLSLLLDLAQGLSDDDGDNDADTTA